MERILVVDDELSITTLLKYNLEQENFVVDVCFDGKTALELATNHVYDFIVLDLMLPKMNGFEVTKHLRREQIKTPILMLTAKDETENKIHGLQLGADDYLTKPFSPKELIARIQAVLRRIVSNEKTTQQTTDKDEIRVGCLFAYPKEYRVLKNGEEMSFTKKEFELLIYLMKRQNKIISRDELMTSIWQDEQYHLSRTVDIHISHLREKIELDPKKPEFIKTIRGFGYKFQGLEQ